MLEPPPTCALPVKRLVLCEAISFVSLECFSSWFGGFHNYRNLFSFLSTSRFSNIHQLSNLEIYTFP